jgi:hypothetical protein
MNEKNTYFLGTSLLLTLITATNLYCNLLSSTSRQITFAFFAFVISITATIIAIGIYNKD